MFVLKQEYFLFPKEIPLSRQQMKIFHDYVEDPVVRNCCPRLYCTEQENHYSLCTKYVYDCVSWFFFFFKLKFCVANYLCKSLWGTWFGSQVSPCADLLALSSCMHCDSLRLLGFHRVTFQNLLQNPFICSGFSPLKHRKNFWRFSSGIWIYLCLPELGPVLSSFYLALMLDVISLQVNVGQFYSDFFFYTGELAFGCKSESAVEWGTII